MQPLRAGGGKASRPYTARVAWEHVSTEPVWPLLGTAALIYYGKRGWGWGAQKGFHVIDEGYFGRNTYAGGMDKLGHAWSAMLLSDLIHWRLQRNGFGAYESAITAAGVSWLAMALIEVGDGFSKAGASHSDIVANTAGVAFSFIRNTVPGVKEKLDFRMEWLPGRNSDLRGDKTAGTTIDYQSKKFLFALKASGFEQFKQTPLRYLELHAGYFARGYANREIQAGVPKSRNLYIGVGLNLSELLLSGSVVRDTLPANIARFGLQYIQVPYTYLPSRR